MLHRYFFILGIMVLLIINFMPAQVVYASDEVKCSKDVAKHIKDDAYDSVSIDALGIQIYSGTIEQNGTQYAVVAGYIGNISRWCEIYNKRDNTHTEGRQVDQWNGRTFVTLAVDNGKSKTLNEYTAGGWQSTYGLGAGPQVGIVLEIDPTNGNVIRGTYVISKTEDGLTNSVVVHGVQYWNDTVFITGVASSFVLDPQGNPYHYLDCPRGSEFRYWLDTEMTDVVNVECNGVSIYADGLLRGTGEIPVNLQEPINPGGGIFLYCTDSGGIQVMGANDSTGYELFVVSSLQIGNALAQAVNTEEHVKIGESGIVSLWALKTDEIQVHTTEPYDFIFSRYRCGNPITNGEPITVTTSSSPPMVETAPQFALPSSALSLPIYRADPLDLNDDGTYTIRQGDTLSSISVKLSVDVDTLAELNNITDKRFIVVGQILQVPDD